MNMRFKQAVFLDLASVNAGDLDISVLRNSVENWQFYDSTPPEQVISRLQNAEIAASNKVILDKNVLSRLPGLKLVCITATGTNNIDLDAARELGIDVCNVTKYATASVTQHVFRLILSLYGRLQENHQAAINGTWSDSPFFCVLDHPPLELTGKTLGIIGYGELGKSVAKQAKHFGMQVKIARRNDEDTRPGRLSLPDLLTQIDILSLHCPLTEENFHLIDNTAMELLPNHAIIVNTARGGLVDEAALLMALEDNRIAAAALDVLEREPPDKGDPLLHYYRPNLIITPHIAWASQQSRQRLLEEVALNISAFQQGKTRNLV